MAIEKLTAVQIIRSASVIMIYLTSNNLNYEYRVEVNFFSDGTCDAYLIEASKEHPIATNKDLDNILDALGTGLNINEFLEQ